MNVTFGICAIGSALVVLLHLYGRLFASVPTAKLIEERYAPCAIVAVFFIAAISTL